MLAPERRSRRDLIAAAVIVVVVAVLAALLWSRSEARSTVSEPATAPAAPLPPATGVPGTLRVAWQAPSAATASPVVVGGAAVTADGSQVTGRDPATGRELWRYARDLPLCAAAGQWNRAVAVYRSDRGCSDVTSLDGATGARGPQRDSQADDAVTLDGNGTYLASIGSSRMEVWRSDLVRTLEFGRVDAPINPGSQPRPGCALRSAASSALQIAVVLSCPGEAGDRLSLLSPSPQDPTKPTELGSTMLGASGARVLAVTGERTAVYVPGPEPRIALYDSTAQPLSSYSAPAAPPTGAAQPLVEATTAASAVITWWTGSSLMALRAGDLSLAWTLPDALGPGAVLAGQLLVPVPAGLLTVSAFTGTPGPVVAVPGGQTAPGPVTLTVAGPTLLEQRGATVTALATA